MTASHDQDLRPWPWRLELPLDDVAKWPIPVKPAGFYPHYVIKAE